MMTSTLKLALFIRDLLQQPEKEVVIIGRNNMRKDDYESLQIVIDTIGDATRVNSSSNFDGDGEIMSYAQLWQAPCVVNFYGTGAYQQAKRLMLLANSQRGLELQSIIGCEVFRPSAITDVKALTGEKYNERYELQVTLRYNESADVETLRIDTAQTSFNEDQ